MSRTGRPLSSALPGLAKLRGRLPPWALLLAATFVLPLALATPVCAQADAAPTAEAAESTTAVAPSDARAALGAALEEARATDRLVFLHSGAPWCGWCKRLEEWLVREDVAPVFSKDFVSLKIDVEEMADGEALMDTFTNGYRGVPVLVILDPGGAVLVDSFTPDGRNIGSPQADWEIDYWNEMMRATARRITPTEIAYMGRTWAEDRAK